MLTIGWFITSFLSEFDGKGVILMDWNEGIEEFCLDITIRGFSKITIKNYRSKLKNIADYFTEKHIQILELRTTDVKRLILHYQERDYQASTININISRLKKLFDYLVEENLVQENPVRIRPLPEQKKIVSILTDNEIKELIVAAKKHRYPLLAQRNVVILMLMVDCGLRISEVVGINNQDVLDKQIIIRNSKNNKDRAVAISPVLKKELIKYKRIKKKKYHGEDQEAFIVSYQQRRLNKKAIWEILRGLLNQTGIRKSVHPHTFRHTYASMQVRNGLDIFTISLNMGHSEINTTQKYLSSLRSDDFIEKSIKTSTLMNLK
ncbi:integrase/recombinase XerD [Enterococcus sp. DIV0755b]